jgi:hypothetical protein
MAQTALTITALKENNYNVQAGDLTVTQGAADTSNGNAFTCTGKEILVINNTDSSSHTFTMTSVADVLGRSDSSLTNYSVAANTIAAINCNTLAGWKETTGQIFLTCGSALVKFAVLQPQH